MRKENNFIKILDYYKNNFNQISNDLLDTDLFKGLDTSEIQKGFYERGDYQFCPLIEKSRIINILNKGGVFDVFLDLSYESIIELFKSLTNIHLGLIFFEKEIENAKEFKTKHSRNKNDFLSKTIDYLETFENSYHRDHQSTIEYLKFLHGGTNNKHFTKKELFQDLFYKIDRILYNNTSYHQIMEVTNKLIEEYFDEDINFSKSTKTSSSKEYKYNYGTTQKGITLNHK